MHTDSPTVNEPMNFSSRKQKRRGAVVLRVVPIYLLLIVTVRLADGKDERPKELIAGKQVEADAKLKKGDKLVAVYEKKNYLVEVREVKPNNKLRIVYVESGDYWNDASPNELYYIGDATPTRKKGVSPLPEAYRSLDKNKDGQIGLYEWDRAKYAEFKKLDKNGDGFLTPLELAEKPTPVVTGTTPVSPEKTPGAKDSKDGLPLPSSGNLVEYDEKVDETFTFVATGKTTGGVWGTGIYSTDSDLAAVAVHAGVLKDGAKGLVKVTITKPVDRFTGSTMNGVTSVDRQELGAGYTVQAAP